MVDAANINIEDPILVKRCSQGDTAAMERLILKYQNRLYNIILRICANPDDAAELTQDTFVKIIESIDGFQGRSSFYTWAFRIAVNLTLNHCKRNVKIALKSMDAEVEGAAEPAQPSLRDLLSNEKAPDPADLAQAKELQNVAIRSLMQLDDDHRAVVVLRDLEGMTYAQIADVLDMELGTVRSRLSRARSHLREILEAMVQ